MDGCEWEIEGSAQRPDTQLWEAGSAADDLHVLLEETEREKERERERAAKEGMEAA